MNAYTFYNLIQIHSVDCSEDLETKSILAQNVQRGMAGLSLSSLTHPLINMCHHYYHFTSPMWLISPREATSATSGITRSNDPDTGHGQQKQSEWVKGIRLCAYAGLSVLIINLSLTIIACAVAHSPGQESHNSILVYCSTEVVLTRDG